jgi:hypothetical protein
MAKKLGVLVVHGMGDHKKDYSESLKSRLKKVLNDFSEVHYEECWWQPVLNKRERQMWNDMRSSADLDYTKLRRFVINALGDAVAYQGPPGKPSEVYYKIHEVVFKSIKNLEQNLEQNAPLAIICSSLGTVIMSNYIWDRQNQGENDEFGTTPFQKIKTHCAFYTMGSNIPLFTLQFKKVDVECIDFPGEGLSDSIKSKSVWKNIFDKDDILGYPLKKLSYAYKQSKVEDIELNIGGIITNWNPASHMKYYDDKDTARIIGNDLRNILNAL